VVLLRRAMLVSLFVFLPANAVLTWTSAANVTIFATHVLCWPFQHAADNWMECMTLLVLSWQPLMLAAYASDLDRFAVDTINALLIIGPCAVMLVSALMTSRIACKTCRRQNADADNAS
jgi:hypothetical protein